MKIAIISNKGEDTRILVDIIAYYTSHEVIWTEKTGLDGIKQCQQQTPDTLLIDLELPDVSTADVARAIMEDSACAIVVIAASIDNKAGKIFEAMGAGALDACKIPASTIQDEDENVEILVTKIATIEKLTSGKKSGQHDSNATRCVRGDYPVVVIGASTGGPIVLAEILTNLPADYPHPIIIVQHVDEQFSSSFASWLNDQTTLNVRLARNADIIEPGTVLIAGTSDHLTLANDNRVYYTENPKDYVYRPSVDVLFNSVAERWKGRVLGILLTGMGRDGASGLLALRNHGAHTISQDKESCAVYGMPKAAADINASCSIETVDQIIDSILKFGNKTRHMVKSA